MQKIGIQQTALQRRPPPPNSGAQKNSKTANNSDQSTNSVGDLQAPLHEPDTTGERLARQQTTADALLQAPTTHQQIAASLTTAELLTDHTDNSADQSKGALDVTLSDSPTQSLAQNVLFNQSPFGQHPLLLQDSIDSTLAAKSYDNSSEANSDSARSSSSDSTDPDVNTAQEHHQLAADLLLPDDPVTAGLIANQTTKVETLLNRLSPPEAMTDADKQLLVSELNILGELRAEAGIESNHLEYESQYGRGLLIRYTASNPPPDMRGRQLDNLSAEWSRTVGIGQLSSEQLHSLGTAFIDELVFNASSQATLEHQDVFGVLPPSQPMQRLQDRLATAQTVPSDVDTDQVYQVSMTVAQLRLVEGDLKNYEYRLTDAARALLGDQGWGVHRDHLFTAHRWIEEGAILSTPRREGRGGNDLPRSEEELRFVNVWNNSSREERIEHLGFDVEAWNQASPLLDYARLAHKQRKDAEFGLDDFIKIGAGIFISVASANTLGPAVAGWLSGTGVLSASAAGVAGSIVGASAGTLLSTLVTTGDWVTAREAFKDVFEGDLKEGLAQLVLQRFGLDPRYATLVNASNSNEITQQLTRELGLDIIQEFGGPLIDRIQDFTPDVVDRYLDDFDALLQITNDPDQVAEHAIAYWGAELAGLVGVTNSNGIRLITSLLDHGINYGELDIDALRNFFGAEVEAALQNVPAEVVERLGGRDSTLAVLAGVATRISVDNIDAVIDGDSFLDAATSDLEAFVEDIAIDWVEQGGLEDVLSFIPHAENWTPQFRDLVLEGHNSGWDRDTIQAHLSESSLFSNLVNSYVPGGFAHDMLSQAINYGANNGWDTQTIVNAATTDVIEIIGNAGISQDIVRFLGGNDALLHQATNVFGQRLIANNGDLGQTLRDMEVYARGLAAGIVGDFSQSVLQQVLGPGATQMVDALAGLAEGHAAGWSNTERDAYVQQNILAPLGQSGVALIRGAFGGEDNFVTGLLGAMADAYAVTPGDEGAARAAGLGFLVNSLSGLTGGTNLSGQNGLALPPSPLSLPGAITNLIQHAQENNWNRDAITAYVEDQFLNHELGSTLINSLTGTFGNRTQVAGALVEELIGVWQATEDPVAVVESLVEFLMNPPSAASINSTSATTDAVISVDNDGNIIDLSSFAMTPSVTADATNIMNLDGTQEPITDTGTIRPLASYTSALQAIVNADGLDMSQRYDMLIDTSRFYLAKWADDHQQAIANSEDHNQQYWLEESELDPNLNRAAALLGRVGHNLWQGVADTQSFFSDQNYRQEAGEQLYELVSNPGATATAIENFADSVGELPLDQQIELGAEIVLTGFVGGAGFSVGSRAASMTGDVARNVVDSFDGNAMAAKMLGTSRITDDTVYISRPPSSSTLQASIGVPHVTGEVFSIRRLSAARSSQIDLSEFRNPLTNEVVPAGNWDMSVDHILPVKTIVDLPGFNRLTKEQMKNLIQDLNGDIDNLMALPKSMNSSKKNLTAQQWADQGYRRSELGEVGNLDSDYVDWLNEKQIEVTEKATQMIAHYLNN